MIRIIAFLLTLLSSTTFAQEDARRLKLDGRRPLRLEYLAQSWNKKEDVVDTAAVIVRDALTGRLAKVEMTETGSNTSEFIGIYRINFQNADKISHEITPEVYVAPLSLVQADLSRIEALIKEGTLLRKPYFLRVEKRQQIITIFDSRAQALEAYQIFLKNEAGKPLVDPAALDAQRMAKRNATEAERLKKVAEQEMERTRLEALERARQEERKRQAAQLDAAEKARRAALAETSAKQAMQLYQNNNFKAAEEKFNQAIELNPENNSYAFQYGVTLYRNEKFEKAGVVLKMAEGPGVNVNERDYYRALSHMKLREYENGYSLFNELKSRDDKNIASLSAFYAGVIDFQNERYDNAKSNFEFVLDHSKDPKIDQQAETYIEQIANIKRFEEMRKKKWILGFNTSLMHDSNILSVSPSNATSPTDLAGFRWSYGGSVEFRPVFSEKHEFSGILTASDMYSVDKNFKAKTEFQNTDPMIFNLSFPYKWKGVVSEKPAQLGITPAYETIQMNADGTGARETIVNSTIIKGDGTFVMKEDYFAYYALELRNDNSLVAGATGDNDQSANKITASTTQTSFQDSKKTRAVIGDASLGMNMAKGANQKYNRVDLSASYLMPGPAETVFLSRFAIGHSQYPSHTTGRADTSMGLTLVLQKQFSETWGGNLIGMYNKNNSTLDGNTYDKYIIMTGVNWKDAF